MSDHRLDRLASREVFFARVLRTMSYALALIVIALGIGTFGYHLLYRVSWIDGFHQAAMLLAGMGPVLPEDPAVVGTTAKLFDSLYALFCGIVLIGATGLLFAPVIHRILHRFHLEDVGGER